MNKKQGATIGAVLLAGLLLRPIIGSNSPGPAEKASIALPANAEQPNSSNEGPWVASCNYWSPVRPLNDESSEPDGNDSKVTGEKLGQQAYSLHLNIAKEREAPCPSQSAKRWGLPFDTSKIHLRTMIATVPDPAHTHAALGFDRTIDAIVEAAEDNSYTSSYFWLPWKSHVRATSESNDSSDKEPGHDPQREREPGLIIFKYVPKDQRDSSPTNAYYKVIYLFIVGETATEGVNGDQIKRALEYQEDLEQLFPNPLGVSNDHNDCDEDNSSLLGGCVTRGRNGRLFIIGPGYTGSAASLRTAIDAHFSNNPRGPKPTMIEAAGATSSPVAVRQLTEPDQEPLVSRSNRPLPIQYESFSDDSSYDQELFRQLLSQPHSQYDPKRVFELVEDNTARGQSAITDPVCERPDKNTGNCLKYRDQFTIIRYPREISLLRNAQNGSETGSGGGASGIPSPYLTLSLKDTTLEDSVPHFSREDTPLSQEAQLMTIARTLNRSRAQFVLIAGSSILDELFLMQFLHRACPDVRLLFIGGDLLLEREIDDVPYIGSITVGAYTLIGAGYSQNINRAYSNSSSVAYHNAASYSFWDGRNATPVLASYRNPWDGRRPSESGAGHPPLWETVIGSDGYYPLALLDECSSSPEFPSFQPAIGSHADVSKSPCSPSPTRGDKNNVGLPMYPSLLWNALCIAIAMLCIFHLVVMAVADYWSPFTRDVAIRDNVEPGRRSMYVRIGTAMLFSMAFVIVFPIVPAERHLLHPSKLDDVYAVSALAVAVAAVLITFYKTQGHLKWRKTLSAGERFEEVEDRQRNNFCFGVSLLAFAALAGIPATWTYLCMRWKPWGSNEPTYAGVLFANRCLHPESGVSPVVPILLLLFGWYLWAVCQTWRLRFSMESRPVLPRQLSLARRFFVSDEELMVCGRKVGDRGGIKSIEDYGNPRSSCLYSNITCILITRQILRRFWRTPRRTPDMTLASIYAGVLILLLTFPPMHSLESLVRFTHLPGLSKTYEWLVVLLFFPLLCVSLSGWLRMVLIWGSLRRSVLEALENRPIRFAFSHLKAIGWMGMIRQGGLHEWWRDIARSSESMRQMLNDKDLESYTREQSVISEKGQGVPDENAQELANQKGRNARVKNPHWETMKGAAKAFEENAGLLHARMGGDAPGKSQDQLPDFKIMHEIEKNFGTFAEGLLAGALIPYWEKKSKRLVESEDVAALPIKARLSEMHTGTSRRSLELHTGLNVEDPLYIRVGEEFLAIRYVSLIRSVLVNMRRLMSFVSASFVLAIIAWNSYPFEPRQTIDWIFTALLFTLGLGVVWVLAQVHRDPILNRITDTNANELGLDFWSRVVSLGAVPVLTWLAYTFPDVGTFLFKFLQPAVSVTH